MDVFERPTEFFIKERNYRTGFILYLISIVTTAIMTEILLQYGFVDFGMVLDPYVAILAKIGLMMVGYFVITGICTIPLKLLGGKNLKEFYKVTAYSLIVLIFIWLPHMLVSAVVFAWFIMLMIFGMKQYNDLSYKKGLVIVVLYLIIVIALAFVVHDYVPIFPYRIG